MIRLRKDDEIGHRLEMAVKLSKQLPCFRIEELNAIAILFSNLSVVVPSKPCRG